VLTSLDALATGSHDITYVLILDDDDSKTLRLTDEWEKQQLFPKGTVLRVGPRVKTLNARMNDAITEFPADYYCFLVDDGFPLSRHWDAMFDGLKELPAFAWQELNDPKNATFIAISERWRKATGRGFPDYFPFWFADTWILEVHLLAFAKPIGIVNQLQMGGKRGTTQGMRDLPFWFDFYAKTRSERIADAVAVAKEWGFTLDVAKDRQAQLAILEDGDRRQREKTPMYASQFGALEAATEPTTAYLQAKERAEEWLRVKALQ